MSKYISQLRKHIMIKDENLIQHDMKHIQYHKDMKKCTRQNKHSDIQLYYEASRTHIKGTR